MMYMTARLDECTYGQMLDTTDSNLDASLAMQALVYPMALTGKLSKPYPSQ